MLNKTEVAHGRFLVGVCWQSLYPIRPTSLLKSKRIFFFLVAASLLRWALPQVRRNPAARLPARRAAFSAKTQ
jgi:hypothetical protein